MKRKFFILLILGILILGITGCSQKSEESNPEVSDGVDEKLLQCIESELGGYLVTEQDDLIEIPLQEIKNQDEEKIEYYKGVYASMHPDNQYIIVFPKHGTYESEVMKDFDKYFYERFSVYQKGDISSISIYIHNYNIDVDFDAISNQCVEKNNELEGKELPDKVLNSLKHTEKVVLKKGQKELGTIDEKDKILEMIQALSSSKQYGNTFLCDGTAFDLELYDGNGQIIDTISVWDDGKRLIPSSIHEGCSYSIVSNGFDFRKFIEKETNYVFYHILDFRDDDQQEEQFLYHEGDSDYFLKSEDTSEVLIEFLLNHQTMPLYYALENGYISALKIAEEYPDILIRK